MSQNPAAYAGALSACLRAAGAAEATADPEYLDCLTTMPFGRTYLQFEGTQPGVFLPQGPSVDVHGGIDLALKSLGWSAFEWHGGAEQPLEDASQEALSIMDEGLQRFGPVLAGPLDGNFPPPSGGGNSFAAHFIGSFAVVRGINPDVSVNLEDATGSEPQVVPLEQFMAAWAASGVSYKRGPYTLRARFERREALPPSTVVARAIPIIRAKLAVDPGGSRYWGSSGPRVYAGAESMRLFAADLQSIGNGEYSIEADQKADLLSIVRLAAARSKTASAFLEAAVKPKAAVNLRRQAQIFSSMAALIERGEDAAAAGVAAELVDTEASLLIDLR